MIQGRNIVCIASNWSESPTGKHHIMRRLARRNRVLWINVHASRLPRLTWSDLSAGLRRLRDVARPPAAPADGPRIATPLLVPWPSSRVARAMNASQLGRLVQRHLAEAPSLPAQLWLFTPEVPEALDAARWERSVYCCVDEFSAFAGADAQLIAALERRTLAGADVVIATSQPLFESRSAMHANVHLVPHGVDFEHFAQAQRWPLADVPPDIVQLRRPILGYFGLIADYVDLDLIARVALARPAWNFALLGDVRTDRAPVARLPNVRLLGRKSYSELPAYCAGFDAGIIPFRSGRLTHAVNPIKLREYLAAGLPVISSPMPAVEQYAPAVQVVRSAREFIAAVEQLAACRASPATRAVFESMRDEGWDARVEQLSRIVLGEEYNPHEKRDRACPDSPDVSLVAHEESR